jgi:Patatin-like phospholipase
MPPLDSDAVLRAEATAIHGGKTGPDGSKLADGLAGKSGAALYRALHACNSRALCLSGGGIRSASFALGVIEALAVHPRPPSTPEEGVKQSQSHAQSYLAQFDYLSTVSGGGYIGSWLSAWIARAGYPEVWRKLTGRRHHPDEEPGEIAWLRAYSNYLTPQLGLFSADTWAAIALYVRNLILNWLVIVPALCLLLFAIKGATILAYWLSTQSEIQFALVFVGILLMIWTLRFATRNRPTCNPRGPAPESQSAARRATYGKREDGHRDELSRVSAGADQAKFFWLCLFPAILASNIFAIYLTSKDFANGPLWYFALVGILCGAVGYAISWLAAFPFKTAQEERGLIYWVRDWASWSFGAGGVYGALLGLGAYLFLNHYSTFLIGDPDAPDATGRLLIVAIYGVPWLINAQLTAEMVFVGLTSWERGSDADREWFGRSTGWFAAAAIIWLIVAFLILVGAEVAWQHAVSTYARYSSAALGVIAGGLSAYFGASGRSGATEQRDKKTGPVTRIVLMIAPPLFLILLVIAVSLLMDYLLFGNALMESPLLGAGDPAKWHEDFKWYWIGLGAVVVVAFFSWTRVNINRFSIHALYRNRLMRAYLGASNPERVPNPFTGFDLNDNYQMRNLWTPGKESWQPFHVVNMALNVVASSRLSWQERKAEPFTATPLHCGTATFSGTTAHSLGYRPSSDYGDRHGGLSLGTAMAISGAAASPNMGYNTSPIVSLLLALFNVRLGWWLGNPGAPGEQIYGTDGPRVAIVPFVFEMFGQTTDTRRYVYLSDGGHFENLGLYEMIRRRCRCIVVSDAGCDPAYGFEDLGNAARKIAIDLGVYITFDTLKELRPRSKDGALIEGGYYAIGEIDYKTAPEWKADDAPAGEVVENGYILYVKPGYHGTESAGIVAYAKAHKDFPHETTADQFFSESQFESYRTLGFEIMDGIFQAAARNESNLGKICDVVRALRTAKPATANDSAS